MLGLETDVSRNCSSMDVGYQQLSNWTCLQCTLHCYC